jgi:hypothetical protein
VRPSFHGLWLVLIAAAAAGCSFDDSANAARGCDETCSPGRCVLGYCLETSDVSNPVEGGQTGGGSTAGEGGTSGTAGGTAGGTATAGNGAGSGGTGGGNVVPGCTPTGDETCNALDDDCDGEIDEALTFGSCEATGMGSCTTGVMRCQDGGQVCVVAAEPMAEVCNGLDDDCNGEIDDAADVACYPAGTVGCEPRAGGMFECVGLCAPGVQVCVDGELGACSGFVEPAAEICGGTEPADEDCNGLVDDTCPCTGDQTQSCYTGPARTAGVGRCRMGEQQCENGQFGACAGSITPGTERCANTGADDDCDGVVDDVFAVGFFCVENGNRGLCRYGVNVCDDGVLICDTLAPRPTENSCDGLDEDCDGRVDEAFPLATDEANCGACGTRCGAGTTCCAGGCRDTGSDVQHCGACGRACAAGSSCCGGQCVATNTADHCGGCAACGAGQTCCGGQCVPANTVDHCGGCSPCDSGQACCNGQCVATDTVNHCGGCERCAAGLACCGGECVALDTAAHCGGCAPCATGQACCEGRCVDSGTREHCGGCQACGAGQQCCNGRCLQRNEGESCEPRCEDVCALPCSCVGGNCVDSGGLLCL